MRLSAMGENMNAAAHQLSEAPLSKVRRLEPDQDDIRDGHTEVIEHVTIWNSGNKHTVSKKPLLSHSLYFKQLFEGATCMRESKTNEIELKELDGDALIIALRFMRSETVNLSWQNIDNLLEVATYLMIDDLTALCCEFLKGALCWGTFNLTHDLANKYSLSSVTSHISDFICLHFEEMSESLLWYGLDFDTIESVLNRDNINTPSEFYLFEKIVSWISKSEWCNDEDKELQLLSLIRYCLMSTGELEVAKSCSSSKFINDLIDSAFKYRKGLELDSPMPIRTDKQNTLRNATPTLILVSDGSWRRPNKNSIVACSSVKGKTVTHNLHSDSTAEKICGVVSLENCIYVVSLTQILGGFDHDSTITLTRFDPVSLRNHIMPSPPQEVISSGICAAGKRIYVCGGVSRSNTVFVSAVQSFDIHTLTWKLEPPLPTAVHECAAASLDGVLYVSGGLPYDRSQIFESNTVFALKSVGKEMEWVEVAPMRVGRRNHAMLSINNKSLVVCGGVVKYPGQFGRKIPMEIYSSETNQWTSVESMSTLIGQSLGHFIILPDQPKLLYSLGHELYNAQEHEIWTTNLEESDESYLKSKVDLCLPTHMKLNTTFASFLDLNHRSLTSVSADESKLDAGKDTDFFLYE